MTADLGSVFSHPPTHSPGPPPSLLSGHPALLRQPLAGALSSCSSFWGGGVQKRPPGFHHSQTGQKNPAARKFSVTEEAGRRDPHATGCL